MKRLTLMAAMLVFALAGTAFAAETAPAAQTPQGVNDQAPAVEKKKRPKFEECDTNKDGFLSKEEFAACYPKRAAKFEEMDANKDGKLSKEEIKAWREANKKPRLSFEEMDTNKDGFLSKEEFAAAHPRKAGAFEAMDADKDGKLTKEEIQAFREAHKKDGKGKKPRKNGDR